MSARPRPALGDVGVTVKICAAVAIAALVAVSVGLVGLRSHSKAAEATQQMYQRSVLATDLAQEMRVQLMTIRFDGLNRTYATDPVAKKGWFDQRAAAHAAYEAAAQDYLAKTAPTAAQRKVVDASITGMKQYFALTVQLDAIAATGDMVKWEQVRTGQVTP